jgi:hypothetical protein
VHRLARNAWIDLCEFTDRRFTLTNGQAVVIVAAIIVWMSLPAAVTFWLYLAMIVFLVVSWACRRWMRSATRRRWQERSLP